VVGDDAQDEYVQLREGIRAVLTANTAVLRSANVMCLKAFQSSQAAEKIMGLLDILYDGETENPILSSEPKPDVRSQFESFC